MPKSSRKGVNGNTREDSLFYTVAFIIMALLKFNVDFLKKLTELASNNRDKVTVQS